MKTLKILLLLLCISITGCSSSFSFYTQKDKYKPFEDLSFMIHVSYEYKVYKDLDEVKDVKIVVKAKSTGSNLYKVEIWRNYVRMNDQKIKEFFVGNEEVSTIIKIGEGYRYDRPIPTLDIECYTVVNGQLCKKIINYTCNFYEAEHSPFRPSPTIIKGWESIWD